MEFLRTKSDQIQHREITWPYFERLSWLTFGVLLLVSAISLSKVIVLSVGAGGLLMLLNLRLIKLSVDDLFRHGENTPRHMGLILFLKIGAIYGLLFVFFRSPYCQPLAFVTGLSLCFFTVMVEAGRRLFIIFWQSKSAHLI
jgi:hypothetical protein